jgi:hypothetical protein
MLAAVALVPVVLLAACGEEASAPAEHDFPPALVVSNGAKAVHADRGSSEWRTGNAITVADAFHVRPRRTVTLGSNRRILMETGMHTKDVRVFLLTEADYRRPDEPVFGDAVRTDGSKRHYAFVVPRRPGLKVLWIKARYRQGEVDWYVRLN